MWTDPKLPLCNKTEQVIKANQVYYRIADIYDRKDIIQNTGCHVPCSYVKYEIVDVSLDIILNFHD